MDALKEAYFGTSAQKGDRGYWRNLGSVLKGSCHLKIFIHMF